MTEYKVVSRQEWRRTVITTVLTTSFGWTGGQQRPPDGQFPNVPGGRRESRFRRLIKGNAGGR